MVTPHQIGLISDTHDQKERVLKAIEIFNQRGVAFVLHCGDYVAPFTLRLFATLKAPLQGVFGNCDGEKSGLAKAAEEYKFSLVNPPLKLTCGDKSILVYHKLPEEIKDDVDFIIFGHTHQSLLKPGRPFLLNPGEACGWLTGKATIAILDLKEKEAELIEI
jgi:putative phosphoesterase